MDVMWMLCGSHPSLIGPNLRPMAYGNQQKTLRKQKEELEYVENDEVDGVVQKPKTSIWQS